MRYSILLFVTIPFIPSILMAQTDSTEIKDLFDYSLGELIQIKISTAFKISEKATDAPGTVYVVNRRQIEDRNYSCLKELLADILQIEIQSKSIAQNSDIFTINGVAGNKKILLLMDRIRVNVASGTYSLFLNQCSGFMNANKYEKDRSIKTERQLNYRFSDKFNSIVGISYEYMSVVPKTSDLPVQYNELKSPENKNIFYPDTNVNDLNGNDLTILQTIYHIKYCNLGSYVRFQYLFFDQLSLTAGTRIDYDSQYKNTLNPRIGLVFKPTNKWSMKLLYGQAYLASSPYKAYQHCGAFYAIRNSADEVTGLASNFLHLPNPDLQPEKRISYDANLMYQFNQNLAFTANGYYGQISNLIEEAEYDNLVFHGVIVENVGKPIMNKPFAVVNLTANYQIASIYKYSLSTFIKIKNLFNTRYYNAVFQGFDLAPQDPVRANLGLKVNF